MKEVLEISYYISGVVVALCACLALYQIFLGRRQLKLTEEYHRKELRREMVRCAAEQIHFFNTEIMDVENKIIKKRGQESIPFLDEANLVIKGDYLGVKNSHYSQSDFEKMKNIENEMVDLYNKLEIFSAFFILGLADEELAFELIGGDFCSVVKEHLAYYITIESRKPKRNAVFNLFLLWYPKQNALSMLVKKRQLEKEITTNLESAVKNKIKTGDE